MTQLALGVAGAVVGGAIGAPFGMMGFGASIGWTLGAAIGGTFEPNKQVVGPRLNDLHLSGSSYGAFITRGWGTFRCGCNIIDSTDLTEHESTSGGGKGGGGGTEVHSFTYSASVDAAICEGPVGEVRKIWAFGRLIYDTTQGSTVDNSGVPVTFYLGDEEQLPDPTFEAVHGAGNVPAYRGIVHAVMQDWDLSPWSNGIPQMNFEVLTAAEAGDPAIVSVRHRFLDMPMTWGGYTGGGYFQWRYGPRILTWDLNGEITMEARWSYGGAVTIDAATFDVVLANLTVSTTGQIPDLGDGAGLDRDYLFVGSRFEGEPIYKSRFGYVIKGGGSTLWPTITVGAPVFNPALPGSGAFVGADACEGWGIPAGELPSSLTFSQDLKCLLILTCSSPTTGASGPPYSPSATWGGTPDKWYKIIDDAIDSQGTIDSATATGIITGFLGNFFKGSFGGAASLENNYRWLWQVWTAGNQTMAVMHINDAGVLILDPETAAGTLIDWPFHGGQYPVQYTTAGSRPEPRAARLGIPAVASDNTGAITADTAIGFGGAWPTSNYGPVGAVSVQCLANDGYCGVSWATTLFLLRRLKNVTEAFVTLDIIVGDLCQIVADVEGRFTWDVTDLEGIPVIGFVLTSQMTARAAIESLMPVYFFDAVESDGVVKFVLRGHAPPSGTAIPDDDLAAHTDGEEIPPLLACVRRQEQDLPATMTFTYIDPDRDYQVGSQTSRRMVGGSQEVVTVQCPVVMRATEAKQRVDALLFSAWYEREGYAWSTTRKYVALEPCDVRAVGGESKVIRITKKTERADGVVQFEGVLSFGPMFQQGGSGGSSGEFPGQEPPTTQLTDLELLDIPLIDATVGAFTPYYYAAMAGASRRSWLGASLQKSSDGGTNYVEVASDNIPETIGDTSNALGPFFGGHIFDETNALTVVLRAGAGTLESITRDAVRLEGNLCVVGDELLCFRDAELTAEATYRLTGLMRGLHGTEWAMGLHETGERFVLLTPNTLVAVPTAEIGASRLFKAVTFGSPLSSAEAEPFVFRSRVQLPYLPVYLFAVQVGTSWAMRWTRRTRVAADWLGFTTEIPLGEATEAYTVTIWADDTYQVVKRTIDSDNPFAAYLGVDQVTDFGSYQSAIYWTVVQVGTVGAPALPPTIPPTVPPGTPGPGDTFEGETLNVTVDFSLPVGPTWQSGSHGPLVGGMALRVRWTAPAGSDRYTISVGTASGSSSTTREYTVRAGSTTIFTGTALEVAWTFATDPATPALYRIPAGASCEMFITMPGLGAGVNCDVFVHTSHAP